MLEKMYSKTTRYYKKYFTLLIAVWIVSLVALSIFTYNRFDEDIKDELGTKAMLIAITIAQQFTIQEKEWDRLLSLNMKSLLKDTTNMEFEKKARAIMKRSDIKYIYIEASIPDSKVKYRVEEGEEDIYGMPVGTPLNIVYLLDAVVSDEVRLKDTNGKGYIDKDRYTVMDQKYKMVYNNKQPTYYISFDQWGNYITGYAPIYDSSKNYIGLVGVDIFIDQYINSLRKYVRILGGFILVNIMIGLLAIHLVFRVRKADQQAQEKALLSCTDSLTACLNRRYFTEVLENEWERSRVYKKNIALFFIDIDYFKEFNDHYGHLAGDDLLRKITHVLDVKARKYGGWVGRYGGDEFTVLLSNKATEAAEKIAKEIVEDIIALRIKHQYSPVAPYQTISIGVVSLIPQPEMPIETLVEYADCALYSLKKDGRNGVWVWGEQKRSY